MTSVTSTEEKAGLSLHTGFYISNWILLSNVTILFNKWLIHSAGFRYPVILTWWHMAFATLVTQLLARTTSLLDGRRNVKMSWLAYVCTIIPIGIAYSGSMVCTNLSYLYLSIPFIQMIKAAAPVATLALGCICGLERLSWMKSLKLLVIVIGVVLAGVGEVNVSIQGLVFSLSAIGFESARLILIQFLIAGTGLDMDPLVSLYYFAPVCTCTNFILSYLWGWTSYEWTHAVEVGFWMLLLNAIVAFLFNVASVLLVRLSVPTLNTLDTNLAQIGKTSALGFVLTGVFKNVLLVGAAVSIWATPINTIQLIGYGLSLFGLFLYQSSWDELQAGWKAGVGWTREKTSNSEKDHTAESSPPPRCARSTKMFLIVIAAAVSVFLVLCYARREWVYGPPVSATTTLDEAERLSRGWLTWLHCADGKWWLQVG